jgi:hypothetical protein
MCLQGPFGFGFLPKRPAPDGHLSGCTIHKLRSQVEARNVRTNDFPIAVSISFADDPNKNPKVDKVDMKLDITKAAFTTPK